MNTIICPSCAASTSLTNTKCDFCGSILVDEDVKPIKHLSNQIREEVVISDDINFVRKAIDETIKRNPILYNLIDSKNSDSYDLQILSKIEKIEVNILIVNKINVFNNSPYTDMKIANINTLKNSNDSMGVIREFIFNVTKNVTKFKLLDYNAGLLYPYAFELLTAKSPSWKLLRNYSEVFAPLFMKYREKEKGVYADKYDKLDAIIECLTYIGFIISEEDEGENFDIDAFDLEAELIYKLSTRDENTLKKIFTKYELPIYTPEEIKEGKNKTIQFEKKWDDLADKSSLIKEDLNKKKSGCFIATATMGSYNHPVVLDLRYFRDNWLLKRNWGLAFTKWYYTHGPKAARVIEKSIILKKLTFFFFVKPIQLLTKIISKL